GAAKARLGRLDDAVQDYSRSIELSSSPAAHLDRGIAYARLLRPEKALADFDAVLSIDPNDVPALLGRADANHVRKRLAASLDDYARVIATDPRNATAYFKRGNVHFDLREFAAAFSDYSESLRLEPKQPVALYNRALAAQHLGRLKEAARDRRRALALDPALARGEVH
ncbi:MAG: tetratricopeptide repeat protein, partial [Steroidobacteraceae bacterium]